MRAQDDAVVCASASSSVASMPPSPVVMFLLEKKLKQPISPQVPSCRPSSSEPMAWAESSITVRLCRRAIPGCGHVAGIAGVVHDQDGTRLIGDARSMAAGEIQPSRPRCPRRRAWHRCSARRWPWRRRSATAGSPHRRSPIRRRRRPDAGRRWRWSPRWRVWRPRRSRKLAPNPA